MKKNGGQLILAAFLGLTLLPACSLKKDAETMRDATKNIESNSKQLTQDTSRLGHNMREVECQHGRKEAMEMFVSAGGDGDRCVAAATFLAFQEYQKWTGQFSDTLEVRDELLRRAVEIFFASTMSWVNQGRPINMSDNLLYFVNDAFTKDFRNAGAMAMELDFLHPEQTGYAVAAGVPVYTMYDLIVSGLKMEEASNRGEQIPSYAKFVLRWKSQAIYFLQLRHNFLIAKVMGRVSDFSDNYVNKLLMSTWGLRSLVKTDVDLDSLSRESLIEFNELLKKAEDTKEVLRALDSKGRFKPQYNLIIMDSWKALNFKTSENHKFIQNLKDQFMKARQLSLAEYNTKR